MIRRKEWISVLIGILLTPLFYLLAALLSGGGHSIAAAVIFFPFAMLLGLSFKDLPFLVGVPVFFAQLPLYCLILRSAPDGITLAQRLIILVFVHIMAILVCFVLMS